ncbi:hypothetical protein [Lysinibacillus sp. fls2-241-R2A-57]|uniref:hypothetical protein n=1 Tax=Lysinibacillus sp. fls2-241-R2A-57 TaxID=3040292 RepID=UPI002557A8F7|nr:hypothetical protein [Lysinibacillus sp. fls2-241-R2A-57]
MGLVVLGLALALGVAFMISLGKSNKKKYIIWGITMMLVIAPLFSWGVSTLYGVYEGEGFASVALMMVMFPLLFLIGLVLLLIGIFKKGKWLGQT